MRKVVSTIGLTALFVAGLALAAPAALAASTTSCDGELAPGTYGHVVVPEDAACFSDGPLTIKNGLEVQPGGTLVIGNEENPVHTATINNGVVATNPANLEIHFSTINGGVSMHGGDGPFGEPFDVRFATIEDSLIHGRVVIDGYDGFWMGFIRNNVRGLVTLSNNVLFEKEDANEYVTNTIHGSLRCFGDDPAPQVGDSEGEPNVVTGQKTGQCAHL
jgi:hypothetical protein